MNFRKLVTPVFAAVAASVAAFALFVIFAASEQDAQSLRAERAVLQQRVIDFSDNLLILATDNAWWDEAVEKVILEEDTDWIDETIGATGTEIHFVDGTLIIRPDHSILYSNNTGRFDTNVVNEQTLLSSGIAHAIQNLSVSDDPSTSNAYGLLRIDNLFLAYGASLIRPSDEQAFSRALPATRPVLVFYSVFNREEIVEIGTSNAIEKLRFSEVQPLEPGQLALRDANGNALGWLAWESHAPGTKMAVDMVWPSIILLALVVLAMVRFIKRANTLVAGLEQASKSKTSFLASMSHEVRTPLNAILGFSELMSLELFGKVEGAKNKEYLQLIKDSGTHLLSIINDILDISKLEAGKFDVYAEQVHPKAIIEQCINMVDPSARDRGIAVTDACDTATILSDERILRQILINVLSNAIKFTNQGGAVHVIGERQKNHYQILVTDNGIGMSAKDIEIALTTFGQVQNGYTKIHGGTGLGLPLVKRFVTLLEGTVDISSNPGKGTTVTLTFPTTTQAKKL